MSTCSRGNKRAWAAQSGQSGQRLWGHGGIVKHGYAGLGLGLGLGWALALGSVRVVMLKSERKEEKKHGYDNCSRWRTRPLAEGYLSETSD